MELVRVEHPKVVNSAYFSPVTGKKLMTTCIDNRVRIWNYLLALDREPDREIVHSHDFNRYLTPFRAEWDPKDQDERLFVIGRYKLHSLHAVLPLLQCGMLDHQQGCRTFRWLLLAFQMHNSCFLKKS